MTDHLFHIGVFEFGVVMRIHSPCAFTCPRDAVRGRPIAEACDDSPRLCVHVLDACLSQRSCLAFASVTFWLPQRVARQFSFSNRQLYKQLICNHFLALVLQ